MRQRTPLLLLCISACVLPAPGHRNADAVGWDDFRQVELGAAFAAVPSLQPLRGRIAGCLDLAEPLVDSANDLVATRPGRRSVNQPGEAQVGTLSVHAPRRSRQGRSRSPSGAQVLLARCPWASCHPWPRRLPTKYAGAGMWANCCALRSSIRTRPHPMPRMDGE